MISSSASVSFVSTKMLLDCMASMISAGVAFLMSGCVLSTCGVFLEGAFRSACSGWGTDPCIGEEAEKDATTFERRRG